MDDMKHNFIAATNSNRNDMNENLKDWHSNVTSKANPFSGHPGRGLAVNFREKLAREMYVNGK